MRIIVLAPGWSRGQPRRHESVHRPDGPARLLRDAHRRVLHTDAIRDWRAEGTFNAQHIPGLGLKGVRVWDFGWQRANKGWGSEEEGDIRLLLHATDPDYLERRLGRPASKGCVGIPAAMNRFLDHHGILNADYERAAKDPVRRSAAPRQDSDTARRKSASRRGFLRAARCKVQCA